MKDTEAWAVISPSDQTPYCAHTELPKVEQTLGWTLRLSDTGDEYIEPVVIVSKARYEALLTCERIVHGRAIAMVEERGAEGETKERELSHKADLSVNWH